MSIETTRPICNLHHEACPCREWEHLKVLNELNQLQARFNELEKQYIELVRAVSHQVEFDT